MPEGKKIPARIVRYLDTEIWRTDLSALPTYKAAFIRLLRILILSIRGFATDGCALRASALTFYSLLSMVPAAAMAFGIAKGFGFEILLEQRLLEEFHAHQEAVAKVIAFAQTFLENTRGGLIAGIGVVVLFYTVLKVLAHIESAFNIIWQVNRNRTLIRKFSDYLSILFIGPVLIILSSSATVFVTTQVTLILQEISLLGYLSAPIFAAMKLIPYALIWSLFSFVYLVMPNTRVKLAAGIFAGVAAGTLYQLAQWFYIVFQVGFARYNAIYGSFAALPLFLIWLQISWFIVLFGAEISYACQHADEHQHEADCENISRHYSRILSLLIAHRVVHIFAAGKAPLTDAQLSHSLNMPIRLVQMLLNAFVESAVFNRVPADDNGDVAYQPARDISLFTIRYVIDALDKNGVNTLPVAPTPELETIDRSLADFDKIIEESRSNRLLKDI